MFTLNKEGKNALHKHFFFDILLGKVLWLERKARPKGGCTQFLTLLCQQADTM